MAPDITYNDLMNFRLLLRNEEVAELMTRKLIGHIMKISEDLEKNKTYEDIDGPLATDLLDIAIKYTKIHMAVR